MSDLHTCIISVQPLILTIALHRWFITNRLLCKNLKLLISTSQFISPALEIIITIHTPVHRHYLSLHILLFQLTIKTHLYPKPFSSFTKLPSWIFWLLFDFFFCSTAFS